MRENFANNVVFRILNIVGGGGAPKHITQYLIWLTDVTYAWIMALKDF